MSEDRAPFPSSTVKDVVTSAHSRDEFFSEGVPAYISNYPLAVVAESWTLIQLASALLPAALSTPDRSWVTQIGFHEDRPGRPGVVPRTIGARSCREFA